MFRFYWFVLFLLSALAVHAGYVLFYPGEVFARKMAEQPSTANNAFVILPPEQALFLVPASAPSDIVGICRFELESGSVVLQTTPPRGFWSLTVYTISGKQAHSLTESQLGSTFSVEISQTPDVIQKFLSAVDAGALDLESISEGSWRISIADKAGFAVLWVPLADRVFRTAAERTLSSARCAKKN